MTALAQRLAIIAAVTTAGIVWLNVRGPLPLIRFTTELSEPAPWWYSISVFPVLGMLVADWAALVRSAGFSLKAVELGSQIGIILIVAKLRLGAQIPLSGHVVLLSYFLARRSVVGVVDDPIRHFELGAAAVLLCAAGYAKLMWWSDPLTLLFGLGIGALLAVASWWAVGGKVGRPREAGS